MRPKNSSGDAQERLVPVRSTNSAALHIGKKSGECHSTSNSSPGPSLPIPAANSSRRVASGGVRPSSVTWDRARCRASTSAARPSIEARTWSRCGPGRNSSASGRSSPLLPTAWRRGFFFSNRSSGAKDVVPAGPIKCLDHASTAHARSLFERREKRGVVTLELGRLAAPAS